jgi:hypothetical protein
MPDKMADGGGHAPQTFRFHLFSRQAVLSHGSPSILKSGSHGWNRTSGLQLRKLLLCLLSYARMKLVEDFGTSPNSTGCRPVVSYSVTDPPKIGRRRTRTDT